MQVIVKREGEKEIVMKDIVEQFIPMRHVFKQFFELPDLFNNTLQYLNDLQKHSTLVTNIVKGSLWKEKIKNYPNKTVFPIILYFDDYETNNPLGSHKGVAKCGAVYLDLPILPPEYQSKLENLFLFIIFKTDHR